MMQLIYCEEKFMDTSIFAIIISILALLISFFTFFKNYVKPFSLIAFPSPRIGYLQFNRIEPGILLHLYLKNKGAMPGIVSGLKVVFNTGGELTEFYSFADIDDPESLVKRTGETLNKSIFDGIYLDKHEVKSKNIYFVKRKDQKYSFGKTVATVYYKKNSKKKFIKLPYNIEFNLTENIVNSVEGITFANFLPNEFILHEDKGI